MTSFITNPETHPQATLIAKITEDITALINADSVYCSAANTAGAPEILFSIFMANDRVGSALNAVADKLFAAYPMAGYRLFSCNYAETALRSGNLFMIRHCALGSCTYSTTNGGHLFFPETANVPKLLKRSRKNFTKNSNKTILYAKDIERSMKHEDYGAAAYMLHKTFELLFKTAARFITGSAYASKSIAAQQRYIAGFAPSLCLAASDDGLELLDSCYWSHKRATTVRIKPADIEQLLLKAAHLKTEIQRLFEQALSECEGIVAEKNPPALAGQDSSKELPITVVADKVTEELHQVAQLIATYIETAAIYCFGQRSETGTNDFPLSNGTQANSHYTHYYLLVITEENKTNAIADLEQSIKTKTSGKCTATLLLHKVTALRQRTGHQLFFFHQVVTKGLLVYESSRLAPDFHFNPVPQRNVKASRVYWKNRLAIAETFMESQCQIDRSDGLLIKETMLHIAVEQVCLGMIDTFMGYRPAHYSLSYLFDLCESFSPLTAAIFPRRTAEDRMLFGLLGAHLSAMRHAELQYRNWTYTEILERRCTEFLEKAMLAVEAELESLETETIK